MIHNISRFIAALALLATAQGAWAEWTGTGTSADPYIISTPEDLLLLAHRVNGTSGETVNTYQGMYFKLGADITFSHAAVEGDDYAENYEAIGHYDGIHEFKGNFNGDGHTVSGIRINKTDSGSAYDCQGLFGLIASGAEIHDVHLTDARITGYDYVAGIVAYNFGTVSGCTVTDSYITYNAFDHGAICACNGGTLTNNYYHGCTVNGTAVTSGKGCGGSDLAANNGALPAYAITFGDGVSTTALASVPENGFVYNGVSYYREGLALPLASTHASEVPAGYTLFSANGTAFSGSDYTVSATDGDVTITTATTISIDPAQFSVNDAGTEYTIHTAGGWNVFCDALQDNDTYNRFSGKTVNLDADITVTRMAGGDSHEFTGTFDGGGHTLTVSISSSDGNAAPFREIMGATIRNLKVSGTVSGHKHSAGLVSYARGADSSVENTIENCLVATDVSTIDDTDGDCYLGGIVGHGFNCKLTIRGCAFTGSLTSPHNYMGGLQGWSDGNTLILENDIFAATSVNAANVGFHPIAIHANNKTTTATVTNVYYTVAPTCTTASRIAAAGKATRTVAAADDVTIGAVALTGTATQYTVSGITAYSGGGLQRGQTLYYGSGDQLSLTLSNSATAAPQGYQYGYTASAGTLSGTTLTMPDEDVTISAALAPIDWATVNQGTSKDPYMIYNKDQILLLAHRVNGTNGETANDYEPNSFKLGADITFTYDADEGDDYDENYEAIGGYYNSTYRYFKGIFDGDGHTVSGIRIRKTGSGSADNCQGLFGCISSGADIHDVHLTDARITGYQSVGGIVGYNNASYIRRCSVTDSYITATGDWNYGTICGRSNYTSYLRNNYYHGCTVNSTENATNVGCGGSEIADITDNNGALPAYAITLGANITTPPGTFAGQTEWLDTPPVNPRLAPENGFTLAGNHYFASGYVFTPGSTLASGAAQGYTPRATLGDVLLDLYTPTGDNDLLAGKAIARLTITADCDGKTLASTEAIYSIGQPVTVAYIKADGTPGEASAIALDGHETVGGGGSVRLAAGTYYVGTDITYANRIYLNDNVTLILADGKTMTLNGNTQGIAGDYNLTIYGQSLDDDAGTLRYNGTSDGIYISNYEQHSGNVSITTTTGSSVHGIDANVTLRGGTLTVTANGNKARAIIGITHSILGGHLTATATNATGIFASASSGTAITLGWTRPADRITASSISVPYGGTVAVADGQALTDGSGHIYTGTLTASELSGFAAETTLQPCLALADAADNSAAITDHAGQTLAVALSGRTLYKDGSWNTLCLPFAVTAAQIAASSLAGATIKELNASTSNLDSEGLLTLYFTTAYDPTDAPDGSIEAGKPYIVKWTTTGDNITNPTFPGVTVSSTTPTPVAFPIENSDATCHFVGQYSPFSIGDTSSGTFDGDLNEIVMLGSGSKLGYSQNARTLKCFRAHFYVPANPMTGQQIARRFVIDFGEGETTGIKCLSPDPSPEGEGNLKGEGSGYFTLDGRRISGKPTKPGLYIVNGKKVVIK